MLARRANIAAGAATLGAFAVLLAVALVVIRGPQRAASLLADFEKVNAEMQQRVFSDEARLERDVRQQQQMLKGEAAQTQALEARKYPDGCVCECKASGCDEENTEGPVCKCPEDGKIATSLPDAFKPWPFQQPGAARRVRRGLPRQALYSRGQMQARSISGAVLPPFAGAQMPRERTPLRARFQQKWVGSPQKMLPPDGDYPGGATGIPMDGYLAYETGWANNGPFHGELAPLQEAGIADKAQRPQSLRARFQQKWVGSPQKMLPPDGDYPGGATGIPMDGYLAYETGWANNGPFHGELAPLQEAGIADKAQRPQSLRALTPPRRLQTLRAKRRMYAGEHRSHKAPVKGRRAKALLGDDMFGSDFDERVPATAVNRGLFERSKPRSPILDDVSHLV